MGARRKCPITSNCDNCHTQLHSSSNTSQMSSCLSSLSCLLFLLLLPATLSPPPSFWVWEDPAYDVDFVYDFGGITVFRSLWHYNIKYQATNLWIMFFKNKVWNPLVAERNGLWTFEICIRSLLKYFLGSSTVSMLEHGCHGKCIINLMKYFGYLCNDWLI